MSPLRRSSITLLAAAAFLFAPSPPPTFAAAPAPITLDDVVALLKAGAGESLISREIGRSAPAFDVGVQETLRLKQAGASDQFIERLMGDPEATGADASEPASYRVVREKTADGGEILLVTNLDASGKRMGGEIRHAAAAAASPPGSAVEYRVADEAPPAPVIVNVYPAPPQMAADYADGYSSPYMYRDPYASSYPGGILPGYYPFFSAGNRYAGIGHGGNRGRCDGPGGGPHGGARSLWQRSMEAPRRFAGPTYSPIGPATGYDMYHQHTQGAVRR